MFGLFGCGMPIEFKIKKIDDNKLMWVDNIICGCCHPTPFPCCPACPFAHPCEQAPTFVMDPSDPNKWLGSGEPVFKCGCAMLNNKGDVFYMGGDKDGSSRAKAMEYWPSKSNQAVPPCLAGTHMADGVFVEPAGAPTNAEMAR
jgi:hypothetical protein